MASTLVVAMRFEEAKGARHYISILNRKKEEGSWEESAKETNEFL